MVENLNKIGMLNLLIATLQYFKEYRIYEQIATDFGILISIPIKATNKHSLVQESKDYNTLLFKTQIKIEHILAKFKVFNLPKVINKVSSWG